MIFLYIIYIISDLFYITAFRIFLCTNIQVLFSNVIFNFSSKVTHQHNSASRPYNIWQSFLDGLYLE